MRTVTKFIILCVLCATAFSSVSAQEEECACLNCPVPIYNNSISYAQTYVQVNGENDLATCPLQQVCFEITHTWVGDLSASLISPNGTRYLIMADINNDTLGCGNSSNNINVCVNVGTDNPLTANEEYVCNGPGFWECLIGDDWTVPCGVTDPRTPAVVAPNCDLNDYNTPGAPANGIWTLAVSDICPWDVGFIENFTLDFECGAGCFDCDSDGGDLVISDVAACEGDPSLLIEATPTYDTEQPDTLEYGYTFIISQDDFIFGVTENPDLTTAPPGEYQICGLSYLLSEAGQLSALIGTSVTDLQNVPNWCAATSSNCGTVTIFGQSAATEITLEKCAEDCLTYEGIDYCNEGNFPLTYQDQNGCDSTVMLSVIDYEISEPGTITLFSCNNDCIIYAGNEYCTPGDYTVTLTGANGCDSLVNLTYAHYATDAPTEINLTVCENACATYNGTDYCTAGTYEIIFADENGCDSLVNLTIGNHADAPASTATLQICAGQCGTYAGVEYCETGVFPLTYQNENGCDSLVNLTVENYPEIPATTATLQICAGQCGTYEGTEYCETGVFPLTYQSENGCDSLVNLTVENYPTAETNSTENFTICAGECVTYADAEYCAAGTFPVVLTNENGCDSLVNITVAFTEVNAVITEPAALNCTVTSVTLDASASVADSFIWENADGELVGNTAVVEVSEAICYTLITEKDGCQATQTVCVNDESPAAPTALIEGETLICSGAEITYFAESDNEAATFAWDIPANATLLDDSNSAQPLIRWNDAQGGEICVTATDECGTSSPICLSVSGSNLEILDVVQDCDLTTETYTVSITVNADAENLDIDDTTGGSWNGNIFTSGSIAGGTPFSFTITDGICEPVIAAGENDCLCITDAGEFSSGLTEVCADATAVLALSQNPVLADGDILVYLLHNGTADVIGDEIYAIKTVPEFDLEPTMQTGVTYFATAAAGDALDTTDLDFDDPCLSLTEGAPVLFSNEPTATWSGDAAICDGGEAVLNLTFTGNAPFTATINGEVFTGLPAEYAHSVTVETTTEFILSTVTDAGGCTVNADQAALVVVNQTPTVTVAPNAEICNTDGENDIHILNFDDLQTGNVIPLTWTDTDGSNAVGTLPLLDFTGVAPGVYTFTYTTTNAVLPCENISGTVEITVENCSCPDGSFVGTALCNDTENFSLTTLQNEPLAGTWSITGAPNGQNPASIEGDNFLVNNAAAGTYEITFTLAETPAEGCPTTWTENIEVSAFNSAGITSAAFEFCENETATVDLFTALSDADSGGMWADISANPVADFDANNPLIDTENLAAGIYEFTYTQDNAEPCQDETSIVTLEIHALPVADAGEDMTLTCETSATLLGGENTSTGSGFTYAWYVTDGAFSTEINPETAEGGTYTLVVTNAFGCTASDAVTIEATASLPVPEISVTPVGCYGEENGAIEITGISGGVEPYVYSLDGAAFTDNPDFSNLSAATYNLVIEDANGCQNEINFDITQPQETTVVLTATLDNLDPPTITLGESFEISALVNIPEDSLMSVTWTGGEYLDCDTCLNVTATPIETTTFTVTIQANECEEIVNSITVFVNKDREIFVPNIFSPDDDGQNDVFHIFADDNVERVLSFAIYARWGDRVFFQEDFTPNDPFFGWDGTHLGQDMNSGVFVWAAEVEFIDGEKVVFKGDVTLAR